MFIMRKFSIDRVYISVFLLIVVCFAFVLRLIEFQVVNGQYYDKLSKDTLSYKTTVEPARGEILDRNHTELATSRMSFNIELYKPFLDVSKENDILLNLVSILKERNLKHIDNLFINYVNSKYEFESEKEEEIKKLKKNLKLNDYATAENIMNKLIKDYKLESYSQEQQRILAGIKHEMKQRQFSNATPYIFAKDMPLEVVVIIKEKSFDLKGVDVVATPVRLYNDSSVASHVIGNIGLISAEEYATLKDKGYGYNDFVGKQGVEKIYEDVLKGSYGAREVLRNDVGDIVDIAVTKQPTPGDSVVLTIDKNLQKTTENLLKKYITNFNKEKKFGQGGDANAGAAVVLNVKTGEVLSLATYPTYDINNYLSDYTNLSNDPNKPLFNRALQGVYSPGSIYKPVMVVSGAENNLIDEHYIVNCTKVYTRFQGYQPQCLGYHGNINVNNAMAVSCNIFFYEVGYQIGIDKMIKTSNNLGVGVKTGIQLNEATGAMSSPKLSAQLKREWYPGDVVQAAIGQLDTMTTPLQMATYTATIANSGTRYKTNILKEIVSYDKKIKKETIEPVVEFSASDKKPYEIAKRAMLQTSLTGSARFSFSNYPFQVGTKTGTPQAPTGSNNGTFIAFGPYEDPEIAVAAVIEHAGEGYFLGPMVKEIFDAYFFQKYILE